MKKMLKAIVIFGLVLGLMGCTEEGTKIKEEKKSKSINAYKITDVSTFSDSIEYDSLERIEEMSDVIVKVKFKGEREEVEWKDPDGLVYDTKTYSKVKVMKVYAGDLEKNEEITVIEPAYFADEEKMFVTNNGYNLLNEKGEYILLLRYAEDKNGYHINSGVFGKYDVTKEQVMRPRKMETYEDVKGIEFFGKDVEKFNDLKNKVKERYKD